jgi:hypothetical protein
MKRFKTFPNLAEPQSCAARREVVGKIFGLWTDWVVQYFPKRHEATTFWFIKKGNF